MNTIHNLNAPVTPPAQSGRKRALAKALLAAAVGTAAIGMTTGLAHADPNGPTCSVPDTVWFQSGDWTVVLNGFTPYLPVNMVLDPGPNQLSLPGPTIDPDARYYVIHGAMPLELAFGLHTLQVTGPMWSPPLTTPPPPGWTPPVPLGGTATCTLHYTFAS